MIFKRKLQKKLIKKSIQDNIKTNTNLAYKIISTITAVNFALNPMIVSAQNIQASQGSGTTVETANGVTNIWAGKVVGDTGVNVFDHFQLDANNIANMYFQEKNGSSWQNNLVNFVNEKIDINGTVNAIKNNKIDGNLFFLSKEGMAVGKNGVINAGALSVMTPTENFYNKIVKDTQSFQDQWDSGNIQKAQIPINAQGTISVAGKINTVNGVNLKASTINIEKTGTLTNQASVNFADLVNIKKSDGSIVNAGLNGDLTLKADESSGDIILAAVASDVNKLDKNFEHYVGSDNVAEAKITVDGSINSHKDVKITAEATNGVDLDAAFSDGEIIGNDDSFTEAYGQLRKNIAIVDINGVVTGEHVDIQANTINNFVTGDDEDVNLGVINDFLGVVGPNLQGAYGVLANEATVNINKNAIVTAKAAAKDGENALNISANSKLQASIGASTTAIKVANFKASVTGAIPATAVTYAKTDNKATVNIKGTLKSNGNTNIEANADSRLEATALSNTTQLSGDKTNFNVGVLVASGKNKSEVNIENTANISNLSDEAVNGNLNIAANSTNSVNTQALATGKENAMASTAINVTNYDSDANVNIKSDLKAKDVDIAANNIILENSVSADNSLGGNRISQKIKQSIANTMTANDIKEIGKKIKDSFIKPSPSSSTPIDKAGDMISIGASVGVVNEHNNAKINISNGADIQAIDGDVDIKATNTIVDTKMSANGISSNYNDDSNNKVLINASVLYTDMENNASVVIEGSEDNSNTTKITGTNVNITAQSQFQYNRVNRMIGDLLLTIDKLEKAFSSNGKYKQDLENLRTKAQEYQNKLKNDPNYANNEEGNQAALDLAIAIQGFNGKLETDDSVSKQIEDIFTGPFNALGAIVQFANPGNYANFQVGSSTGGKNNGATAAIAGSANVTNLTNNANVLIGKNTDITATKDTNIKANVAQDDVALVGKILTSGGDNVVGGNINLYFGDTNSLVVVGEGSTIDSGNIKIDSDNDINHTGITFGAGDAGKIGITGMINVMEGDSNSLISIDDEVTLNATKSQSKDDNNIDIKSHNNTTITNIVGNVALGTTAGVGASVGITNYNVNNIVAIGDNDIDTTDEEKTKIVKIIKGKTDLDDEALNNILGKKETQVTGSINANKLNVDLVSDGMINTVTVAGSVVTGSDNDKLGLGDEIDKVINNIEGKFDNAVNKVDGKIQGIFKNDLKGVTNSSQGSTITTNPSMGEKLPELTISGAGSSSVNLVNASTSAIIDGVNINLSKINDVDSALNVKAKDSSFIGAWSGAAAISWKTTATEQNWNNKTVGISGAIGINQTDTEVSSIIKNSTIKNAKSITNVAEKSGALVAAGLSLGLSKDNGGGAKYNATASVSYNESDNKINAIMQNNNVSTDDGNKTNLTNSAYNNDTQVTGGLNTNIVAGGDKGMALGTTVTVSNIKNNVNSQIIDGKYTNMGDIEVNALTDITQISTAIGVSVDTAYSSTANLQGEVAYNKLDNNANASIEGATITTDSVSVVAQDITLSDKKYEDYLNKRGIDATGDSYLNNISDQVDDLHEENGNLRIGKTGNKIVAGSLGINVATGKGGVTGTAAVSINDINNDFNAKITNAHITANGSENANKADVNVSAKSDSLIVNVAAGNATSTNGFGAAGSISWQNLDSDVKAIIENSEIVAGKTDINAINAALGVNVAGQLGIGKNTAGLAIAYNSIENNTGAYILGSDISNNDKDTEITLNAQNEEAIYAVGAGVSAGLGDLALNGSIGINRGNNNVEAIIDKYENRRTDIKNVKKLNVNSSDSTQLLAVAGGITASKGVAVGGAVAYNEIGNISGNDEDEKKQNNIAQINNTDITTSQNIDKTEINVKATDNSQLTTVGVGVGGSGSVAVQGAAATSIINKDTEASLTNTNINKDVNDSKNNINVEAVNNSNITSSASVAAGSGTASVGAGVAVNQINQDTKANINGGQYNIENLNLKALSTPNIENIGIGGSVGGTAGITGSVAVNQIHNDTTASINDGANIVANGNVGIVAQSDENIKNYAGGVSGGGTAGVGLSVSVNQIDGNTSASISGTKDKKTNVTAKGNSDDTVITNSKVNDNQIHDELISDETVAINSQINREQEEHKGIVVDASSTHDIKSFIINGGVAGNAGVAGTVNVNTIGGSTEAGIEHAILNGGMTNSSSVGNVFIQAGDYTNSAGFVGSLGVGITGAGVGMASDTAIINRETSATLENSDVKAKDMAIQAISKQGISSFGVGAGIAGIGGGVAGLVTVTELNNKTSANLLDNKVNANTIKVNADHYSAINAGNVSVGGAGIGAGVGLSVGVLKDNSDTQVNVKNTDSKDKDKNTITATNDIDISANNKVKVAPMISATGIGAAGVAGATSVNNLNSTVKTNIGNVKLQSKQDSITAETNNKIIVDSYIGGNAAGAVGVGASVTVNTIDSTVQTNVDNSDLEAKKDISLTANEERDIKQLATNAVAGVSGALGANIVITNIGKAIDNKDVKDAIAQANNAYGDFNLNDYTFGMTTDKTENPTVDASLGGDKNSQITVNANNSKFVAGNKFTANASEIDNISMTSGSGTLGSVAVNAGVGILDVKRHTGIEFKGNNEITAKDVEVKADVSGTTKLNIYQGSAGLLSGNAAYGKVMTAGSSSINLNGVKFKGNTSNISIKASDEGITSANILGVAVGVVSVGAIIAEAENQSGTTITIENSEIENAENTNIEVNKSNTVEAHATGGSGGVVSGNGVVATAKDAGVSSIVLGQNNILNGTNLNLKAIAKPSVTALADSIGASIVGSAGANVATAETIGSVSISLGENNILSNDNVNIEAKVETQEGKDTTTAKVEGNSGAGLANVAANVATATTDIDVKVDISKAKYKTKTEEVVTGYKWDKNGEKQEIKETVTTGLTNLKVNAINTTSTVADARGVTVGGVVSSGNNIAKTVNNSDTTINLTGGSTDKVLLKSLSANASGTTNAKVTANGDGGGLISGDLAGYVDNKTKTNTTITMNGSYSTDGNIDVQASQSDKVNMNANALKATVVGASATKAVNNITGNTTVNINDAELTSTGTVNVGAVNNITVGDEQKYAVEGSGYGGVNVQGAKLDNIIDKSTDVKLTNAKIYSVGTQTLEAKTIGNINVGGYIKAAGLGAATWVNVDNSITTNNKITVDRNSAQKTTGIGNDIILSASDDMDIKVDGIADTQGGAAGGASSDVTNTLNRNNKVDFSGNIYSMQDVNIYAGKDKNGNEGRLDLTINSEAYNKTVLAVASPKYKNTMTQNNQVLINDQATVDSVRNINLYADAGKEAISENSIMYTWYYSEQNGSYTSSTIGDKEPDNKKTDNFVQNNGKLTAGVQNKQYITIGGNGQIVFLDPNTLKAVQKIKGQEDAVGADGIQIEGSDNIKNNIEFGTMDYGNELFNRYKELNSLISDYSENKSSAAYLGYVAERTRILEQMKSLGLLQEMSTENGETTFKPVEGMTIDYVSLPDIIASGGNINIQSDNLKGSGEMTAKGAPEIEIINNTNLYLKVNNVVIGDAGGEIIFNNQSLQQDKANEQINNINTKYKDSNLNIEVEDNQSTGSINIEGNYGGSEIFAKVIDSYSDPDHPKEQTITVVPKADIEINGVVSNANGTINITSQSDNIVIQGDSASSSAGVIGRDVHLNATKGSVSQGYTDGIVNIGGSVKDIYKDPYNDFKEEMNNQYGFNSDNKHVVKDGDYKQAEGNMIVGENIYINAADINVNGYMQSGYGDYELNVDDKVQGKIDQIQKNWENNGAPNLADAIVTTGDAYKIVIGENRWDDTTQSYIRAVEAYYNPATGKIIVPDIDAHGGQVHLKGRISNTGGGTIKVLDGAYDININNKTNTDLQLGKLISNDVEGLISITDTGKNTITEMRRGNTIVKKYNEKTNQWEEKSNTNETADKYNPEEGLRYNWTTGQETVIKENYKNTVKKGLWGLVETKNEQELTKWEREEKPISSTNGKEDKGKGEFIGKVSDIDNNKDVVFIYDNTKTQDSRSEIEDKHYSTGFLGWFKWTEYTWSKTTGTTQQYVGSVKADHAINIGFIGNENGNSNISVNSQGNINITNNIASSNNNSIINITSQNGAITQTGGNITGNNIKLNAQNGIKDINIISNTDKGLDLSAVNKGTGNVDITVNAGKGNAGNVNINQISTNKGNVSLVADGNINQTTTGVTVKGDRIDLTSLHGGIGNQNQAIVVHGGQSVITAMDSLSASVNAGARDDIYLTQDDGDMRLGRVYSDQGDVTITVNNGNLVDALPTGESVNTENSDTLIAKWKELGLIDNGEEYTQSEIDAINSYKDSVQDEYAQYEKQKDYYDKNTENISQDYKDAYNRYNSAKQVYDKYEGQYDNFKELSAYYQDKNNVPKRDNYRDDMSYQQALTKYNQGKAEYDAMKSDYQGFADADSYIKAQMGDRYNDYTNPTVENRKLKTDFDNYSNYAELKNRYGNYDSADSYLNSAEAKDHIAGLKEQGAGWKQEDLLYAIADSIINPDSGAGDTIIKDPNLKGNNITINVKNGSVGLNSDNVTDIDLRTLSGNEEALKKLANADASNVVWDSANGTAHIYEKSAVGIQMNNGGKLNVTAKDNVYLSGRTENNSTVTNAINIEKISAGGDIRIQGKDGIYNVNNSNTPTIEGNDLLIQAGNGAIGTNEKNMTVDLTGKIQAQASGNIYLEQTSDENAMKIYAMSAGGDIVLKSAADMVSVDDNEEEDESIPAGYIRSDNGNITLEAKGNVGTQEHQIRIKNVNEGNDQQKVSITAGKNVYVQGITTDTSAVQNAQGQLNIANLSAKGNIDLNVNGTVNVVGNVINDSTDENSKLQIIAKKDINVGASITNEKGYVELSSAHDINLNNGTLNANKVDLVASTMEEINQNLDAGKINQSEDHQIITKELKASANNGIDLDSRNNELQNVEMQNLGKGNINLANNGKYDLNVNIEKENDGDIIIHNYAGNQQSNINVSSELKASGNIHLINDATGNILLKETVQSKNEDVILNINKGNINVENDILAGKDTKIEITTGNIDVAGNIVSGNDSSMNTEDGYITVSGGISSGKDSIFKAENGDIQIDGDINSGNKIEATVTGNGNISFDNEVKANKEDIKATINGDGDITFNGNTEAKTDIIAKITGEGDISTADDAVFNVGNDIKFTAHEGDIVIDGDMSTKNDIEFTTDQGNIIYENEVKSSDGDINITINKNGTITDNGKENAKLIAEKGNININNKGIGDINLGSIYAKNKVGIDVQSGNANLGTINGDLVAIVLKDKSKDMNVDNIIAGTQIIVTGDDISLDEINQRPDKDGMLIITPGGANEGEAIDNLEIGNIKTNTGIRFNHLWVNNANIHIDEGQLHLEKVFVENEAHFSNNKMTTGIYGVAPKRDGSDSIYWLDTNINRPSGDLDNWLSDNKDNKWIYLKFTKEGNVQLSNAVLVYLDKDYYSYNQRFSGENLLKYLTDTKAYNVYETYYKPDISLFNRYDVYEVDSSLQNNQDNEETQKIVVEV